MEVVYRRRGVMVEICPDLEYLEKVLEEFRWYCRRQELRKDRMFESVVRAMDAKPRVTTGDHDRIWFHFSLDKEIKHHRGEKYSLTYGGTIQFDKWKWGSESDSVFGLEPYFEIGDLENMKAEDILHGIRLLEMQRVQEG